MQAACMGAELEFGETTSWSRPVIENLDHYPPLVIDPQNLYTRTLLEMTRLSLEMGRGRFLTGIPLPGEPKIWKKGKLYCREEDEDGFQLLVRYWLKWNN
ncbi:MAG: hypothetical protein GYA53_09610 [Acidobacteria bacterium]|nr:hypothetical protein [Acidobacteriota bacterium]